MWSASLDSSRNLLKIGFTDRVSPDEARACAARLEELLPQAGPEFCLLTDLSALERMDLNCRPIIDQMMDKLDRAGVGKIVRVIAAPEQDIGFGIMSLFHYRHHLRVVTCSSVEEAQHHLPLPSEPSPTS